MGLPHIVDVLKGTATRVKGGLLVRFGGASPRARRHRWCLWVGGKSLSRQIFDRGVLVGADGCVERGLLGYRVSIMRIVI